MSCIGLQLLNTFKRQNVSVQNISNQWCNSCPYLACLQLKMLQGILPSTQLLERYNLREYEAFQQAIQQGDVGLFERSMQQNQLRLIANGTYLLLEKLRFLVYRR